MLKVEHKSVIILVVVFTLSTCIDPYSPKLNGYASLLVVDGMITDENASYTVKLSRTIQDQNAIPLKVSDATVYITGENGNRNYLINKGEGVYKTDSTGFRGIIGETYTLHITTPEGTEYESEPCLMQSVPDIDNVYFVKDEDVINNGTERQEGVRIYLDSKKGDKNNYYRWEFEETWKFKVPTPKKFDYIDSSTIIPVRYPKEFCWKNRKSDEILIREVYSGQEERIEKEPILFIATNKSDRLLIQYSILVRQFSISKKEYDFWNNLKQVNEKGGDIFAKQPFTVVSNIRNVNDPKERVLGYFQVSAGKQKRININFRDIIGMNLPYFHYKCIRIEKGPDDYPVTPPYNPPVTLDEIYATYCINSDYYFIEPRYNPGTHALEKLVFARPECANCELTGTITKPDFWVDLN